MPRSRIARLQPLAAVFVAVLPLVFAGCAQKQTRPPAQPPTVTAAVTSQGTIYPNEQLAGIIAPFQNVAIQSSLTEPADDVPVGEGDVVHKGEVLARLDTADLEANLAADIANAQAAHANTSKTTYQGGLSISQGVDTLSSAKASLVQAQANLVRDRADLVRDQALARQGYITAQALQQQETTVRDDEQAVSSARAAVSSAQSNVVANGSLQGNGLQAESVAQSKATEEQALAQAQQQRVMISKATIVSPIDGVVVNRNINPGEYPGSRQIFTLQQVDPIYAVLHSSGAEAANVATGAPVSVSSSDLKKTFRGHVVGVLNQVQPGSTDFEVKVVMSNPQGRLRAGMAVSASVSLPQLSGLVIPETAFTDDTHTAVMTIDDDDTVHTQTVAEVGNDGKRAVVTGLRQGTRVVSNGQSGINEGTKVAVR